MGKLAFLIYLSATKKLPHFFVKLSTPPRTRRTQTKFKDIEILCGQWSWASKTVQVFNADKEIETLYNDDLFEQAPTAPTITLTPITHEEQHDDSPPPRRNVFTDTNIDINKLLNNIDLRFCDNYDDWFAIGCALHHCGYPFEDFDMFSKRSEKYQGSGDARKQWQVIDTYDYKGYTIATLRHYLQSSNPDICASVFRASDNNYNNARLAESNAQLSFHEQTEDDLINEAISHDGQGDSIPDCLEELYRTAAINDHLVASIMYHFFKDRYKYESGKWFVTQQYLILA